MCSDHSEEKIPSTPCGQFPLQLDTATGLLSADNIDESQLDTVLWYPNGGYACYFVEVGTEYWDVPSRYAAYLRSGPPRHRSDPLRLRWVSPNTLKNFRRSAVLASYWN